MNQNNENNSKKKKIIIIITLIIIIILMLLCCIGFKGCKDKENNPNNSPTPTMPIDDSEIDWDKEHEKGEETIYEMEYTEIPGYANLYVSQDKQGINLHNPPQNTVYFKYSIYEKDKLLFESDLISPDKMVQWKAYEQLSQGEHNLTFIVSCYDLKTQANCNGATQDVTLTVK